MPTLIEKNIYQIQIKNYPWSDAWALAHAKDNLWFETTARTLLDGRQAELNMAKAPSGSSSNALPRSFSGDRGICAGWVWVILKSGILTGTPVWVMSEWLLRDTAVTPPKICQCALKLIIAKGCQCGGA